MEKNSVEELWQMGSLQVHEAEEQLIIALDFGTTFSGIAYAFHNGKSDLVSILDWPGLEGYTQPKVPTVISYDPKTKKSFTWGAQQHKNERIEGIKLLLDPDQDTPIYLPATNTAAELKRLNKPAVDVAADYISAIYQHALSRIEAKVPADYLQLCQKKFVVSVPAVWSDKAKDTTTRAAKQAGLYPIHLIKEPEAAALYTLHEMQDKALAIGDAIVLCDAGGGTVDLISYEITALSPLELKELVPGKGGMAGSLGLNKRFEQEIKNVVGDEQFYHLRKTKGFNQAMIQFDKSIKTAFRGGADEEYYSNCWNMRGDTMKRIFQPLIADIQRFVDDQVNLVIVKRMSEGHPKAKEIKAIFLVGGFGSSEYLKQCLQQSHPDIQVLQPHDAWSAIVKGAVLSQLPNEAVITSTQATRHYGVSAFSKWEAEDAGQSKEKDRYTGLDRVHKMTWYIYQGDDLQRDQKITLPFYRSIDEDTIDSSLVFTDQLMQCESLQPAKYPQNGVTKINCSLTSDLTSVDRSNFKRKMKMDGSGYYYDVSYSLAVTVQAAAMKFSLEINGKEMGSVVARYD